MPLIVDVDCLLLLFIFIDLVLDWNVVWRNCCFDRGLSWCLWLSGQIPGQNLAQGHDSFVLPGINFIVHRLVDEKGDVVRAIDSFVRQIIKMMILQIAGSAVIYR
jgi:hypothetical protein